MFLFIIEINISIVLVRIKMFIGGLGLNKNILNQREFSEQLWRLELVSSLLYRFIILGLTVPNVRSYPIGKAVPIT